MVKTRQSRSLRAWLVAVVVTAALGAAPAAGGEPPSLLETGGAESSESSSMRLSPGDGALDEYDPWEPFNERVFEFNRRLDRFVLKPVATAWDKAVPSEVQRNLGNAFKNAAMPKRLVNNLLQGKFDGAVRELGRFVMNSTLGVGGLFDVATAAGVEGSDEDTGQTLGVWGVGPGPYLVLPFLPPLTIRDGVGFAIDSLLDPINYVAPFAANAGTSVGDRVNARSRNLEVFDDFEASTLDLYSATRNAYLQRRQKAIQEDAGRRRDGWQRYEADGGDATPEAP